MRLNCYSCVSRKENENYKHKDTMVQITVFKGGTAFNGILKAFHTRFTRAAYIVPVSDDGGSSREICRVFGGPSIGDVRSTLTRLANDSTDEARAVKKLLEYRLSSEDYQEAAVEWQKFLEDTHPLLSTISSAYRGLIRCFLCMFERVRLQRISCRFDLRNGSIGNFFFTGARIVLGSLETAIFVYRSVAGIPLETQVIPVLNTSDRLQIAAVLENGEVIIGQDAISHPGNGIVNKVDWTSLPAPIKRLYYANKYAQPIVPTAPTHLKEEIEKSGCIIYGIGSFWTSIASSLILDGVGESISKGACPKIGMLNSCHDRESEGMTGYKYILLLTDALNRYGALNFQAKDYITHLISVENSGIAVEEEQIRQLGIESIKVPQDQVLSLYRGKENFPVYSGEHFIDVVAQIIKERRKILGAIGH